MITSRWIVQGTNAMACLRYAEFIGIREAELTPPFQVHRICFALSLFHAILSLSLIGVKDTRDKRAAIQNGLELTSQLNHLDRCSGKLILHHFVLTDGGDPKYFYG